MTASGYATGSRSGSAPDHPVPFEESAFQRIGEYGAFPVFRRTRAMEEVIYVPTRKDMVMPYRLKP